MSSWALVRLGDICEKITDGTHHSPPNGPEGAYKYVTAKNIKPWGLDLTGITYVDATAHREIYSRCDVRKDDILYVKDGATTGRIAINTLDEEFSLLSSVGVLRSGPTVRPRYLAYALQEPATFDRMLADTAGVAITRLTLRKLNDAEIRLAPLEVQDHIVEKLDEVLSELDAGVAELKAAQRRLTQYRQSLLKAAMEGTLTADWRAARGKPKETGAELLQRILKERRARWEQKQLTKFAAQGKEPPKDWKTKYQAPVTPDVADLHTPPATWTWASLDQVAADTLIGLDRGQEHQSASGSVGYIKMNNVSMDGEVDMDRIVRIDANNDEASRYEVIQKDLLFNTRNSKELVGKVGLVRSVYGPTVYNNNLMRIRFDGAAIPEFVCYQLCGPDFRERMEKIKKATTSVAAVYAKDLFPLAITLPPAEEQHEIVSRLDAALSGAAKQETAIESLLKQAAAQRRSLLKAAFSGQLVPQDPNDEPASALLARIRAERESGAMTTAKKRGRKAKERA